MPFRFEIRLVDVAVFGCCVYLSWPYFQFLMDAALSNTLFGNLLVAGILIALIALAMWALGEAGKSDRQKEQEEAYRSPALFLVEAVVTAGLSFALYVGVIVKSSTPLAAIWLSAFGVGVVLSIWRWFASRQFGTSKKQDPLDTYL